MLSRLAGNGRPGSRGLLAERFTRTRRQQKVFADFENASSIWAFGLRSYFRTRRAWSLPGIAVVDIL